jgi:hypothetical protein
VKASLSIAPVAPSEIKISLTQDALTLKEQVLLATAKITAIGSAEDMEACNPVIRMLKGALKDMEDSRKDVKGPVTALGKSIDAVAKDYSDRLIQEEERIKGLIAAYLAEQQKLALKEIKKTGETTVDVTGGSGIAAVDVWDFEIKDLDKAYQANKGLFDIVPKRTAIINAGKAGFEMKHIRVFKTMGVRVAA